MDELTIDDLMATRQGITSKDKNPEPIILPPLLPGETSQDIQKNLRAAVDRGEDFECPGCGTINRENKYSLEDKKVRVLRWIADEYRNTPDHQKHMGVVVSKNEKTSHQVHTNRNFHRLHLWGLLEKRGKDRWAPTLKGVEFVNGKIAVPRSVIAWRGEFRRFTGREVHISEIMSDIL